jgi:hypothetical protein
MSGFGVFAPLCTCSFEVVENNDTSVIAGVESLRQGNLG